MTSHGRGGAGNMSPERELRPSLGEKDLKTPEIKQKTYTTGRGGSGNMANNESAESARRAQDINAPPQKEMKGTYHWGRGGEGNKMNVNEDGEEKRERSIERTQSNGHGERKGSFKAGLDKGKEMLGLKKQSTNGGSAIADD